MASTREQLRSLLEAVLSTAPEELDCERFFEHVAAYLDCCIAGDEFTAEMKLVEQHLRVCPECLEAFEALKCTRPGEADQL